MGYFKTLELEIREMDFDGIPLQQIADSVGLSINQVLEILSDSPDDVIEDPLEYAEHAADLDVDYYGSI